MIDLDNLCFDQVFYDMAAEGIKMNMAYLISYEGFSRPPIERWRTIQKTALMNPKIREYILDQKTYKDFIDKAINYELALPHHTLPMYWRAVLHGCLEHVLDLHVQAGRQFPFELLMIKKTKYHIDVFDLLPFTNQAHLTERLLSHEIWAHKRMLFKEFYHTNLPNRLKTRYPFHKCDRDLIEYGFNKTTRTFGHSIKKRM